MPHRCSEHENGHGHGHEPDMPRHHELRFTPNGCPVPPPSARRSLFLPISTGPSPAVGPGTSPGSGFSLDHLSSSEAKGQARPGLSRTRSCLSRSMMMSASSGACSNSSRRSHTEQQQQQQKPPQWPPPQQHLSQQQQHQPQQQPLQQPPPLQHLLQQQQQRRMPRRHYLRFMPHRSSEHETPCHHELRFTPNGCPVPPPSVRRSLSLPISTGPSPAVSPGTSPGSGFSLDHLSSSEAKGQARPGLSRTRSFLSRSMMVSASSGACGNSSRHSHKEEEEQQQQQQQQQQHQSQQDQQQRWLQRPPPQQHHSQQQQSCMPRRHYLRIMPHRCSEPEPTGCPVPPPSARHSPSHPTSTCTASLPRPGLALKSPTSSVPSVHSSLSTSPPFTSSSPFTTSPSAFAGPAAAPASFHSSSVFPTHSSPAFSTHSPPTFTAFNRSPPPASALAAAASATFQSSPVPFPPRSPTFPSTSSSHAHPSPSIAASPRRMLVRQHTEPTLRPNLPHGTGLNRAVSLGTSPGYSSGFNPGQLSFPEPKGHARPDLIRTRSCLSRSRSGCSNNSAGETPTHVRRVSFNSLVRVRWFIDSPPHADSCCCSGNNVWRSDALNRHRSCSERSACNNSTRRSHSEQQQPQQTGHHDAYSTPPASFTTTGHPPVPMRPFSSSPSSQLPSSPSLPPTVDPYFHVKPHPPPPRNSSHPSSLPSVSPPSPSSPLFPPFPASPPPHARTGMPPSPAARRLMSQLRAAAASSSRSSSSSRLDPLSPTSPHASTVTLLPPYTPPIPPPPPPLSAPHSSLPTGALACPAPVRHEG
ncbi:hypothetical protein CLOP_g11911 [Closterium sp. NIES-67]|nr:hypothetical protein CLOP_g11911 [Closterium sp. NIES-67]